MFLFLLQNDQSNNGFELDTIWNSVFGLLNSFLSRLPYIVIAIIVFGIFLIVARLLRRIIKTAGQKTLLDKTLAELLGRLASFVVTILGLFVAAVIIFPAFKPGDLITGLGITSVAIGFAFKDVLQNFFAGILILWRRPFVVGDQIKFREFDGTVEEINVRATKIKTYDGERAVIPNGDIYTNAILVRTAYDRRRTKLTVGIGYSDSINEAKETIMDVLRKTEGVLAEPASSVHVAALSASAVDLNVLFWTKSQKSDVRITSDRVAAGIKLALDRVGIDMPYPHSVVLFNDVTAIKPEGKK